MMLRDRLRVAPCLLSTIYYLPSSMPHVIRLCGPWEYDLLERSALGEASSTFDLPLSGKVQMPCDWSATLGDDFFGRVRYVRHFNSPTNLGPRERVWLVFDGADHSADVMLNGEPLGRFAGEGSVRFEITQRLAPHNRLEVEVSLAPEMFHSPARGHRVGLPGGLTGEVRLEIETV
jgi:beta-galactosidase/beta-glucuronidase